MLLDQDVTMSVYQTFVKAVKFLEGEAPDPPKRTAPPTVHECQSCRTLVFSPNSSNCPTCQTGSLKVSNPIEPVDDKPTTD